MSKAMMKVLTLFVFFVNWTIASATENQTRSNSRIVGGYVTDISHHKHLVQLRYFDEWICGGSLVSNWHVATASHCVEFDPNRPRTFSIKAGATRVNGAGTIRQVSKIWMHPNYKRWNYDCDIAVLKLYSAIQGSLIAPIPLATRRLKNGEFANIAGWGLTRENGYTSNVLRAVYVPVVGNPRCNSAYGAGSITNRMMCAGKGGKDACQGDSGGPLTYAGKLFGIVSWGEGCARPNYPGVYTNVFYFKTFIKSKLKL